MTGVPAGEWNGWLIAFGVLLVCGLAPALLAACRGTPPARLAGLSLSGTLVTVLLLIASRGFGRAAYGDLALVLAVLGPVGVLVFARFLGGAAAPGRSRPDAAEEG
ncbi:monovalent cation/H+ antiporter complex subunit F [Streptomyces sp. NPDC053541]|uniref:monovalent cation/H+ antiporter complex subunit F n=1 Tax=Streptomyces sp. NPDC053541 TaxID=3365709 RepID=UPI0037D94254